MSSLLSRLLLASLILSALTGCAGARHSVHLDDVAHANRQFGERAVTVVLTTGVAYPAEGLRFAPDSTSWIDPATGDLWSTPTSGIVEIRHRNRVRTASRTTQRGALAGAVGGGTFFGYIGYELGDFNGFPGASQPTTGRLGGAAIGAVTGALVGAATGAGAGLLWGLIVDPTETFVVVPRVEGGGETAESGEPAPRPGVASTSARPD